MATIYLPQNITQTDLARAVVSELRKQADAFEREWLRPHADLSFIATLDAANKLGVECVPKAPDFTATNRDGCSLEQPVGKVQP